jgi:hypothetical protein
MYTLQGKIQPTRHTLSTLSLRMTLDHTYLTWSVYSNLSWVINSIERILLLLRKSAPDSTSQPSWVAHGTCLSFSSNTTIEAVGWSEASVDGRLLGLLGSYNQYAIDMFNTCSRGPTHRFLTNIGRGYNLRCDSLPHHTHWPSQPTIIHFSPKGPTRLSIQQLSTELKGRSNPKSREWGPPLDFYHNLSSKHSMSYRCSTRIRLSRINQKVDLIATMVPNNSYQLNAQPTIT